MGLSPLGGCQELQFWVWLTSTCACLCLLHWPCVSTPKGWARRSLTPGHGRLGAGAHVTQINGKRQGSEPAASLQRRQKSVLLEQERTVPLATQTGLSWAPSWEGFRAGLEESPLYRLPTEELLNSPTDLQGSILCSSALLPTGPKPLRELAPGVIHWERRAT